MVAKLDLDATLADNIVNRNKDSMDGIFLTHGEHEYTYGDLFSRIKAVMRFIERSNVEKGDRIGLISENSIEYVAAHLACMLSGQVLVPMETGKSKDRLDFIIKETEMKMVLASDSMHSRLGRMKMVKPLTAIINKNTREGRTEFIPSGIKPDELAMLLYTSGTTGEPVAVKLTHRNLTANTASVIEYLKIRKEDRLMLVLPMFHCYGMSLMHMMASMGGEIVINNSFMFPQKVLDEMVERECTIFAGVPATYKMLMKMTRIADTKTSLRHVYCCAGKLGENDLRRLRQSLPGTEIILFYGQTEASPRISYLPFEFYDTRMGSIGRGIPGVEVRVVDEQGRDVRPGETGEIIARGENVSPGYWNAEEKTMETFRNGWLHTGDLAKVDEERFMYIVGRRKDFVKVAGKRFSLTDVEEALASMDGIREVAAVMVHDEILGEASKAFIVTENQKLKEGDVMRFCKQNLPPFKVPREVVIVDGIPKNALGKVQKRKLLQEAGKQVSGQVEDDKNG
jgi:long-chain acyl-CoA synthetase